MESAVLTSDRRIAPSRPDLGRSGADDGRTRDRVVDLLWREGPMSAAELASELGISAAAVRRHLDALEAQGRIEGHPVPQKASRGRGRPAREFFLTTAGRERFPHAYDDLAVAALRHLARSGGAEAVTAFAQDQLAGLEERCTQAVSIAGPDLFDRAQALAGALSREGYAATASSLAGGGQLCQHHCPVAHVAAEFPQLCEAETAVISRLVGTHVQRLATIARGDSVCTTNIPSAAISEAHHSQAQRRTEDLQLIATTPRVSNGRDPA
ncbi:MAG: transcriptional regulator [Geodermatophilaceae bacterium]|nr:transcriptional regulator [Geodermatophilaceae bacterium]